MSGLMTLVYARAKRSRGITRSANTLWAMDRDAKRAICEQVCITCCEHEL